MNDFYDLNNFMAFVTRKLKIVFVIVCISIIGFAGIRFVGGVSIIGEKTGQLKNNK